VEHLPYKARVTVPALVLANLIPILGVVIFDWDVAAVVLLYWAESLVVGFYYVVKILMLPMAAPAEHFVKALLIPFFCFHFGGFCAVHGFFLMIIFKIGPPPQQLMNGADWPGPLVFLGLLINVIVHLLAAAPKGLLLGVIGLGISHGISFVGNHLVGEERKSLTMVDLMLQPYVRIMVMHGAIILGGVCIMLLRSPIPLLIILVLVKIVIDVQLHLRSHRPPETPASDSIPVPS
jgi:hypothetical protein